MSAHWPFAPLSDVCQFRPPKAEARHKLRADDMVSFVPMEDLGTDRKLVAAKQTRRLAEVDGSYTYFAEGDVLLAKITPCFENGKLAIAVGLTNGVGFGSSEYFVLRPGPQLTAEWLYYYLARQDFRDEGARHMSGAVGHKRVEKEHVEASQIPVPSRDEQQRIVAVLDEAFAGIAAARANAERNLRNARALFEARVEQTFTANAAWHRHRLGDLAAIQYGYTQSATEEPVGPKFLRITDIRDNGVDWSTVPYCPIDAADRAKFLLSDDDIVFARTGATTGKSFLVSQPPDAVFASYLIRVRLQPTALLPAFVNLFFQTRAYWNAIRSGTTGSAQGGFNASKLAELVIPAPNSRAEQEAVVRELSRVDNAVARLEDLYQRKLAALDELKQSLLHYAFTGQLTASRSKPATPARPARLVSPIERHAGVLAIAHRLHVRRGRGRTFGHVKSEKIAHLVESHLGVDLGRRPVKAAAGPNDFPQLLRMEAHARQASWFDVVGSRTTGYEFRELAGFDAFVEQARADLGERRQEVEHLIELLLPLKSDQAELVTTVYAAWNNRLLEGLDASDESIVRDAREHWHPDKLKYPRDWFFEALTWLREHGVTPSGTGKRVADAPPSDPR